MRTPVTPAAGPRDLREYLWCMRARPGDHHGEVIVFEMSTKQGPVGEPLAIPTGGGSTAVVAFAPHPRRWRVIAKSPRNSKRSRSPRPRPSQKRLAELESERARIVLALHSEHGLSIRSIAALLAAAQMPITPAGVQKLVEKARKER